MIIARPDELTGKLNVLKMEFIDFNPRVSAQREFVCSADSILCSDWVYPRITVLQVRGALLGAKPAGYKLHVT